jgi:hypothetical protein
MPYKPVARVCSRTDVRGPPGRRRPACAVALRGTDLQLDLRRLMDMQALSLLDHLLGRSSAFIAHVGR